MSLLVNKGEITHLLVKWVYKARIVSFNVNFKCWVFVGFHNPRPASAARTQLERSRQIRAAMKRLHLRICAATQRLVPWICTAKNARTSYSVNHFRFAEASVASALRAQATLTAIITRLPLSKIENN